jgi:hypothetical protein
VPRPKPRPSLPSSFHQHWRLPLVLHGAATPFLGQQLAHLATFPPLNPHLRAPSSGSNHYSTRWWLVLRALLLRCCGLQCQPVFLTQQYNCRIVCALHNLRGPESHGLQGFHARAFLYCTTLNNSSSRSNNSNNSNNKQSNAPVPSCCHPHHQHHHQHQCMDHETCTSNLHFCRYFGVCLCTIRWRCTVRQWGVESLCVVRSGVEFHGCSFTTLAASQLPHFLL